MNIGITMPKSGKGTYYQRWWFESILIQFLDSHIIVGYYKLILILQSQLSFWVWNRR
jgi:hypothetical protein